MFVKGMSPFSLQCVIQAILNIKGEKRNKNKNTHTNMSILSDCVVCFGFCFLLILIKNITSKIKVKQKAWSRKSGTSCNTKQHLIARL